MTEDAFKDLLDDYLLDARERLDRLEAQLLDLAECSGSGRSKLMQDARREMHTLKGNSGMMGLMEPQQLAHTLEDAMDALDGEAPDVRPILEGVDRFRRMLDGIASGRVEEEPSPGKGGEVREAEASVSSVRVPFGALDELMDLMAEMVIFKNRLANAVALDRTQASATLEETAGAFEALSKTLNFVQDRVMHLRLMPLQTLFGPLRRIVHDEAAKEGKAVRFEAAGGSTPLDKALLETAHEALGHIVRNAVIHGIETPDMRSRTGKPSTGAVVLSAQMHADEVWIDVADDGGGLDRQALLLTAELQGTPLPPGADIFSLIFAPGFSTQSDTSISAGRGIGLSAALEAIKRMGGRIEVFSEQGRGTCFRLHLPLSISITRALLLQADAETYALPLSAIVETLSLAPEQEHVINHAGVMPWRGGVLPLLDLGCTFGTARRIRDRGYAVIVEADGKCRGLIADTIVGIRDIVVKGLDPIVGRPPGISGSTILGDGRTVMILDPPGLITVSPFTEKSA